jgi:hypothetical protein
MGTRCRLTIRFAIGSSIVLLGLLMASLPGCAGLSALSALQTAGPLAMAGAQQMAAAGSNAHSKSDTDDDDSSKASEDEDSSAKCDQVVRHPPGVEEIRRTADLNIESREMRLQRVGESYRWEPYRSHGSSPEGWRRQSELDHLHFDPPLQYLLSDKKPRYLVYVTSVPETAEDSEQMISVADEFGPKVGSFEWHDVRYNYMVSKQLPCFPVPEEK